MEYANFKKLCTYLGDQSLPEDERWKSLKYINIAGQVIPGFDFQRLLRENRINFINSEDIGPGFTILDNANSDMGITNINDPVLSFIPLISIDSVTFVVTKTSADGSKNISINELTEEIQASESDIPVTIKFSNSIYYFSKGENIVFPVIFSRNITAENYDVTYEDRLGNALDSKPTEVGSYYVKITCKDGYVGESRCKFEIQP